MINQNFLVWHEPAWRQDTDICLTNNVLQECKQTIKNLNNKHAGDWPGYNIPEGTAAKLTCLLRKYHPENIHLLHDG